MKTTITMNEIKTATETWSRKNDSPRGYETVSASDVKRGDEVIRDGRFVTVIEDETENERREALAAYLIAEGIANEDEVDGIAPCKYYDHGFTFGGDDYLVLSDIEADEEAREAILRDLWAFNADFIIKHTAFYEDSTPAEDEAVKDALIAIQGKICEGALPLVRALIKDVNEFAQDAIDADGRGQFLAMYDGEEGESGEYFIYRN